MIRWLYALAMTCAQPLLRRRLARRGRVESGYLEAIGERFGRYASPVLAGAGEADDAGAALSTLTSTTASPSLPAQTGWVWIHAVSLGETRAAAVLLAELRRQQPDLRLLLNDRTAQDDKVGFYIRRPKLDVWRRDLDPV